jgi:ABC-type multidrug transport system fused ATPase/permease subunit
MELHKKMLLSVIYSPIKFFEKTPVGRILNRFSTDQITLDKSLYNFFSFTFYQSFNLLGVLIFMTISIPISVLTFIPASIFFWLIYRFTRSTYRDLKRLSQITISPVLSLLTNCIIGNSTIRYYYNNCLRAYKLQNYFKKENIKLIENHQKTK